MEFRARIGKKLIVQLAVGGGSGTLKLKDSVVSLQETWLL